MSNSKEGQSSNKHDKEKEQQNLENEIKDRNIFAWGQKTDIFYQYNGHDDNSDVQSD